MLEKKIENHKIIIEINPIEKVKLDINIPAVKAMCTNYLVQEEKSYLETIKITFEKSWREINHWEGVIADYISCCQTRKEFSPDYFHHANKQYR